MNGDKKFRETYILGNWKMAQSLSGIESFFSSWSEVPPSSVKVGVFPSFPYLELCVQKAQQKKLSLQTGAQDCSTEKSGAFTGEVSATMLKEVGASYVLIGHSERRQRGAETNESLSRKLKQVEEQNLTPVFCVGESHAERVSGRVESILHEQLQALKSISGFCLIAYEPVWAIGTGLVPKQTEIADAHAFIQNETGSRMPVLYGGSVKPENAREILSLAAVNGLLVGGASLKANDFKKIVESAYPV